MIWKYEIGFEDRTIEFYSKKQQTLNLDIPVQTFEEVVGGYEFDIVTSKVLFICRSLANE